LHQRDKDTNEIVSIKAKDIHIPQKLGGIELTPMQQEISSNGKVLPFTRGLSTAQTSSA
jgi:hypothetical protein